MLPHSEACARVLVKPSSREYYLSKAYSSVLAVMIM